MTAARTIIRNAVLLDLDPLQVRRGELRVEMGIIVAVGPRVEAVAGDVVIDAGGAVVMPGLVNGHTHLYSALAAGMPPPPVAPTNFHEILQYVWWRLDRALDLPLIEASATIGALDALHCGTTALIDHHASPNAIDGSLDAIEAGLRAVGLRGVLCYETTDRNGPDGRDAGLRENERYLQRCGPGTRGTGNPPENHSDSGIPPMDPDGTGQRPVDACGTGVPPVQHRPEASATPAHRRDAGATPDLAHFAALAGAHAAFTMSDESLLATVDLARRHGVGVHIHVAEDPCDARICRERFGAELLDRLDGAGILELPSILAHCTHLCGSDLARVNASAVSNAHNTRSNMNNAVGYAPLPHIRRPAQLGTDGIGGDMLAELQTAWFKWRDSLAEAGPACRAEPAPSAHRADQHRRDAGATPTGQTPVPHQGAGIPPAGQVGETPAPQMLTGETPAPQQPASLTPAGFVGMLANAARRASQSLGTTLGRLEPGAAADLVVTDYVPATPLTAENAAGHLIFALSARHIRHVMVAGQWKLRDRTATSIDEIGYRRTTVPQAHRLWERMAEL